MASARERAARLERARRRASSALTAPPLATLCLPPPHNINDKQSLRFDHATDAFFRALDPVLRAPLPRVWQAVE